MAVTKHLPLIYLNSIIFEIISSTYFSFNYGFRKEIHITTEGVKPCDISLLVNIGKMIGFTSGHSIPCALTVGTEKIHSEFSKLKQTVLLLY